MILKLLRKLLIGSLILLSHQAIGEGRVYLMTNSESANVTLLHLINSSGNSQSFTGTLYNGDGERLGAADQSLHNGKLASQARLILSATDLEAIFSTPAWSGPAMLVVEGDSDFELMTKLTSPSGLVSNTNCVRQGAVHNLEGFDSPNNTFVRFINTGNTTINNITGTVRSGDGAAIGSSGVTFLSSLPPNAAIWLNRSKISELIGAQWNGIASLEVDSTDENLKLLNLNFVNAETFFNFSCFETSTSGDVYLMTNSASANVSETHIVNTGALAQTFSATVYDQNGNQRGGASSTLHTGSVAPNARITFTASDLESATGADVWNGPALVRIQGSDNFELMTRLTSPSGLVSNTNCVRQHNVHNIEGFDSGNKTFVRFINAGADAITGIRGTLYDIDGGVLGEADTLLIEMLAGNGAKWLNRDVLSDLFNVTWEGEASLVVTADDDADLRLLNLNFVNNETFFNFSCYERNESAVDAATFFEEQVSEPIIQQKCILCHKDGGVAGATPLIYASSSVEGYQALNFSLIQAYVSEDPTRAQTLLDKARGVNHGGGAQLSSDSDEFQNLSTFMDLLGVQTEVSSTLDSYWDGVSFYTPAQTLRRASVMISGAPPSQTAIAAVNAGGESALRRELRALMTGDGFHEFLTRGANDRLLTDSQLGFFDAADQNFSYFPMAANDRHEKRLAANGEQFEDFAQVHWYWGLARAPVELIAYIVENDRNYQEVVTADYMMMNKQTNAYLNGGASFNENDSPILFKPGQNNGQIVEDDQLVSTYSEQFGRSVTAHGAFIDYPHAGVLNTHSFLGRYPTTETNRNRARARWTYYFFLGVDIEKAAPRTTDPVALADTNNPTMNNPACTVCHAIHDPVAGTFQNYGNEGWYRDSWGGLDALPDTYKNPQHYDEDAAPSQYQHGDTWFRDMRTPSFEGRQAPNNDNSVQWLASEIADDPRFPTAAVKFWWPALMGSPPVEAPEVTTDVTFTRQLNAFEAQNAFINHLGEAFEAGINGGSAFNGKDLLVELMMSPWFRADRAATEADRENYVTQMGTRRLLSPEELEAKGEALFGWRWGHYDNQVQEYEFDGAWTSLGNEYRIYYGGIDSEGVVERSNALTSVMSNVAQKHSLEVACPAVMIDFERPNNQRLLFKDIEPSITPENGEVQIREKIAELHNKLWGVRHSPDDPEVIATYSVLVDVRANRTQWMQQEGHGDWAYVYPFESCNFYLAEHWEDGGIGHRGADPTFMKNAWMAVITYLTSDFQYLHE